jgi:twitching motility protein PilT
MRVAEGTITVLLAEGRERGASDLHLVPDAPPTFRIGGILTPAREDPLSGEDIRRMLDEFMAEHVSEETWGRFPEVEREVDLGVSVDFVGRVRVNCFLDRGRPAAAFRLIPPEIPTVEELELPRVVHQLIARAVDQPKGLVLVTGPTGSGKTTTLAAIVNTIAQKYRKRIITIEDPIEYELPHGQSLVSQREVGRDTYSFADGLRAALREDPDIILVGEMRDLETIQTALTAAETGHLVLSTLHTNDATMTCDRIIDIFPAGQQQQVRSQLSDVLLAVLSQRLLPAVTRRSRRPELAGRVVACEVLLGPMADVHAVRAAIKEGKTASLYSIMETGADRGMQTMEKALAELVKRGLITREMALASATRVEQMRMLLGG